MGQVTIALTVPSNAQATARSTDSRMTAALQLSGNPSVSVNVAESGDTGSESAKAASASPGDTSVILTSTPTARARAESRAGSDRRQKGGTFAASRIRHAAMAISGPTPDGSPAVKARGDTA